MEFHYSQTIVFAIRINFTYDSDTYDFLNLHYDSEFKSYKLYSNKIFTQFPKLKNDYWSFQELWNAKHVLECFVLVDKWSVGRWSVVLITPLPKKASCYRINMECSTFQSSNIELM